MIELAKQCALEAGAFLKESLGMVLQIDRQSEAMIISRIKSVHPDHDFLAEESGGADVSSRYRWIIDPLDGTVNYTHGVKTFCVSIGLEVNGEVVLGVIYDPNLDELYTAEKGEGAFLNGNPIHVSSASRLIDSLLVTGFPYNIKENPYNVREHFNNFLFEAQGIRRIGSAALDLCYVAAGRFDGYWEVTLSPWDLAAGYLIVHEAGGVVTDFTGAPTTIYRPNVLASNGKIHALMVDVLGRVRKEDRKT